MAQGKWVRKEKVESIRKMARAGKSMKQIAATLKVALPTAYKYAKEGK